MRGSLEIISSVVMFWIVVTYISVMYVSSAVTAPTTSRPRSASVAVRRSERDREARRANQGSARFSLSGHMQTDKSGRECLSCWLELGRTSFERQLSTEQSSWFHFTDTCLSDVKTTTSCAFFSIQLRHGLLRLTTTMTSHNLTNACRCVFYINLFLRFINLFSRVPNVDFMSTGLSCFRSKHISQFMFYVE